jgi:hypothetical protein
MELRISVFSCISSRSIIVLHFTVLPRSVYSFKR